MTRALSCTRKADRAEMARLLVDLAERMGARATLHEHHGPREIVVCIDAARGAGITVELDGDCMLARQDCYVACWKINGASDACFADVMGEVNSYHFQECNIVEYSFERLLNRLESGLWHIRYGTAFDARREAESIKKNGTAAERAARWAKSERLQREESKP